MMLSSKKSTSRTSVFTLVAVAVAMVLVAGCDSMGLTSDTETSSSEVKVGFTTTQSSLTALTGPTSKVTSDSLIVTGSNGTLALSDVRLIVSEVELEGEADSTEFESGPRFLDLPLDSADVAPVASEQLSPGSYTSLEFEVEDVDFEEEDERGEGEREDEAEEDEEEQQYRALRDSVRQVFPNWPSEATMVAVGTFTPEGDTSQSFTTFFEAEIEVERDIEPPLEVTDDGVSRVLTVKLDPTQWFGRSDGSVSNLAASDFERTGEIVEFEAEFEDGVTEIEVEHEDDEEDRDEDDDDEEEGEDEDEDDDDDGEDEDDD